MSISDGHGLLLTVHVASASPHETKLVGPTIERCFLAETPERLIGDRGYYCDPLDVQIRERSGAELVARHNSTRSRKATQDGRVLRRYRRRLRLLRQWEGVESAVYEEACGGRLADCRGGSSESRLPALPSGQA
jgi:Transposase DDE domain